MSAEELKDTKDMQIKALENALTELLEVIKVMDDREQIPSYQNCKDIVHKAMNNY